MARKGPLPRLTRRSGGSAALSESAETIDLTASPPERPAVVSGIVSYATRADSESPKRPSAASGGLRRSSRTRGDSLPSVRVGKSSDSMAPKKGGVRSSPRTPADSPRTPTDSESLTVLENGHTNDQMAVENGSLRRSPRMVSNTLNTPLPVVENGRPTTAPVPVENRSLRSHPRTVTVQNGSSFDPTDIRPSKKAKVSPETNTNSSKSESECFFVGDPIPEEEARSRWPHRYKEKGKKNNGRRSTSNDDEDEVILDVKYHYCQASVCGSIFNLGDCAYVKGEEGKPDFVGRILEFFETLEGEYYIRVQWFFRADDTIMAEQAAFHDKKRLFYSDLKNDNLVDCIVSKVRVVQVPPSVDLKSNSIPPCDFYYDMKYSVEYSTFYTMEKDDFGEKSDLSSSNCSGTFPTNNIRNKPIWEESYKSCTSEKSELALLDLYSGCGGMSTGLCLGSHFAGVKLVTRWAVDSNQAACASMQLNHPETQVRNENVDDFFALLKGWEKLCKQYITNAGKTTRSFSNISKLEGHQIDTLDNCKVPNGEYEVLKLVDICYGDPTDSGKRGLKFKVRWKGYSPSDDTWEQIEELSKCKDRIQEFVREGFSSNILPLPGDADVLCGGPPCQGISGLNRHRNVDAPLDDEKNRQIVVFMDIVQFLKPKYVLMENVVDILKFAGGTLGRYALSRLVFMNYQARIGIMAAGCYGLPQFRLRTFFWGSLPFVKLPQFPLPTHDVIMKGGAPNEFERNLVAYDQDQPRKLEKALVLKDVLSDLPSVSCNDVREQMEYEKAPETDFQRYIRCSKYVMVGSGANVVKQPQNSVLYDHCPLQLHEDNCVRVSKIPRRKGASFRDLPGIIVKPDNSVDWDPTLQRILLASGRPLVPDFVTNFMDGKSTRPFARLWWDETVPTVLTNPSPHYQAILHPEQDRVLTVRENARLQGFPDYYRFCGTIKERYTQVGNAVAIPVGRALGYALGMAWLKQSGGGEQPLITLPAGFSLSHRIQQRQTSSSSGVKVCVSYCRQNGFRRKIKRK